MSHATRGCDLVYCRLDITVFGAEVVSPLRNTMGLINGYERDLERFKEWQIILFVQRLRCHIEQFGLALFDIFLHAVDSRAVERRVEIMSHGVVLTVSIDDIDLILHQGDER